MAVAFQQVDSGGAATLHLMLFVTSGSDFVAAGSDNGAFTFTMVLRRFTPQRFSAPLHLQSRRTMHTVSSGCFLDFDRGFGGASFSAALSWQWLHSSRQRLLFVVYGCGFVR